MTTTQNQQKRTASWGNWGITFVTEHKAPGTTYGIRYEIHGNVFFPVGAQGPIDGYFGSPERATYQSAIKNWMENGVLPANIVKD